MSDFKIEKGVPLDNSGRGRKRKYPFDQLEVDDSILITDAKAKSMSSLASNFSRKNGVKLKVRSVDDGVRVWRVA